jgi:hypothetical protein
MREGDSVQWTTDDTYTGCVLALFGDAALVVLDRRHAVGHPVYVVPQGELEVTASWHPEATAPAVAAATQIIEQHLPDAIAAVTAQAAEQPAPVAEQPATPAVVEVSHAQP